MASDKGIVYLVGAGPGDPGLITVKGMRLLQEAQVVVYDALANPRLLEHCPPECERIYVGKRAAQHSMTQEQINALLVQWAQQAKRIVRLKGGDPFVFGRGGEECEALVAAGVPFEVVPGITAAIAAPAYAGIPVTHRDLNSSFTLITGHEKEEQYKDEQSQARGAATGSSDLDWASIAKLPGMAFYMGVKALPRICQKLIEHGMDPATPAASIRRGTWPDQQTIVGTIGDLPQKVADAKLQPPALTIVGKIVALRETMNWFERRPLFGQTIVVTRTRQQASELSERLEALGANVIEAPTIEIGPPLDRVAVESALAGDSEFDWIIFTSPNGVTFTRQRLMEIGRDVRVFRQANIAAIGAATARAVREQLALNVDLCPQRSIAESLGDELRARNEIQGKRFLLLRADIARPVLRQQLEAGGARDVRDLAVYETKPVSELPPELHQALDSGLVNWITFTSSSTAKNLATLLGTNYKQRLSGIKIASIGPITTETLVDLGLTPTVQASTFDLDGLMTAITDSTRVGADKG